MKMDVETEKQLKNKLRIIEQRCLNEELDLIMKHVNIEDEELAYTLLTKYKSIWEFTANVSTSGDSLIVTLPKKDAKRRGIGKGTPVLVALKTLRFFGVKS